MRRFGDRVAQGVRVVAFVGQQHRAVWKLRDHLWGAGDVALLTRRQFQLERPAFLVDEHVDFCGETASRATQTSISIPLVAVAPC